ncbi:Glycosyl transferase family 2 [Friedmanniella luteola]|uniref:4,4'-diaponeurosporenoate glycosyltransferase n=1 Tax=Friedmanniella luteola TaxID=546871 RepID=A0A1H1WEW3_9ACTN|nr:Glycosyl transferase family 2 [Friedmanniella luteola]
MLTPPDGAGAAGSEGSDPSAPRFSVVVPALDEAAHLGRTLRSLLGQQVDQPVEIIVVDNGSTDGTADVARAHGVRVLHEPRRGVCAARQRGAEAARGAIIVSTDADTVHPSGWLRTIDATFTARPDAVAVAGPCRYDDGPAWTRRYPALLFGLVATVAEATGRVTYVSATNLAVRRSAFPGYDLEQTQGGDELDLLRRLRPQGAVLWDRSNTVTTSARRLQRGALHGFVVSLLGRYLLTYAVNRLVRRRVLGTAPAVRDDADALQALDVLHGV